MLFSENKFIHVVCMKLREIIWPIKFFSIIPNLWEGQKPHLSNPCLLTEKNTVMNMFQMAFISPWNPLNVQLDWTVLWSSRTPWQYHWQYHSISHVFSAFPAPPRNFFAFPCGDFRLSITLAAPFGSDFRFLEGMVPMRIKTCAYDFYIWT